jgi:gliding motility-associated-like protein
MIQNGYEASINKFKFSIYTKNGKQVFFTDIIGKGWDGRYKGVMLESDVYYWIIEVTKINGVNDSHRGTFLLLK